MRILKTFRLKNAIQQVVILLTVLIGCQTDSEILTAVDVQNIDSESASSGLTHESSDISAKLIGEMTHSIYSGVSDTLRTDTLKGLTFSDSRLACASVTLVRTGTKDSPKGQITIDYANGTKDGVTCYDKNGVQRKGQIVINYMGKRWEQPASFSINCDFYRNSAHIKGVQNVTYTGAPNDTLKLKLTSVETDTVIFGDGRSIERTETLTKTWYRFINDKGRIDPLEDEWHIETGSNSSITNKNGVTYFWEIKSALIYKLPCWLNKRVFIPVTGKKAITFGNNTYTLDFGDGTCDNLVTVTYNGKEKTISVSSDGN